MREARFGYAPTRDLPLRIRGGDTGLDRHGDDRGDAGSRAVWAEHVGRDRWPDLHGALRADRWRRGDPGRGVARHRVRRAGPAGDPHLLAVQLHRRTRAGPRLRRRALRPARLRPRRGRRARDPRLDRLLGLRRSQGAAVRSRRRPLAGQPGLVQRQGRDDRGVVQRDDRVDGRGAGRACAEGHRADRRDQPLVRLRLWRRGPFLPQLQEGDRRGFRHAVGLRRRIRQDGGRRPDGSALRRHPPRPGGAVQRRRPHRGGLQPQPRLRPLLG